MTTATELCNVTLTAIGEKRSADITTDTTKPGILCNALYQDAIDTVLIENDWSCAVERANLDYREDVIASISLAKPAVITFDTASAALYQNGDQVYLIDITSTDAALVTYLESIVCTLKGKSGLTFTLYDEDGDTAIDLSAVYTAAVTAGTCRIYGEQYDYRYDMPSDLLVVRNLYPSLSEWAMEGSRLVCNDEDDLTIIYTKQLTDISILSKWLITPIAYCLAYMIVEAVKGEGSGQSYYKLYQMMLHLAKRAEGRWKQERNDIEVEYTADFGPRRQKIVKI